MSHLRTVGHILMFEAIRPHLVVPKTTAFDGEGALMTENAAAHERVTGT